MYGPFNTVRAILVAGAAITAVVAAALGWWVVTAILGAAIFAHALLWVWLRRQAEAEKSGPSSTRDEATEV